MRLDSAQGVGVGDMGWGRGGDGPVADAVVEEFEVALPEVADYLVRGLVSGWEGGGLGVGDWGGILCRRRNSVRG